MSRLRTLTTAFAVAAFLLALRPLPGRAQDGAKGKKDAALEDLLKELKDDKPAAKPARETPKDPAPEKAGKADAPKEKTRPAQGGESTRKGGEVAPRDKELDSLLEKLGETTDKPAPDEKKSPGAGQSDENDKPKEPSPGPGGSKPEGLSGKSKDLDEHLEELTGRRRKKQGSDEDGQGPLSNVIKEMRDVEQRLGETDTGEETRKKQQQIVKNLDTLIEQMKASSGKGQGQQKKQLAMKPGQQPGSKPGQQPGNNPGEAPMGKPEKPTNKRVLAGGKDEWGHLPPELRQEMENVFREVFLPAREDLIRRYYDSVAKKTLKRGG